MKVDLSSHVLIPTGVDMPQAKIGGYIHRLRCHTPYSKDGIVELELRHLKVETDLSVKGVYTLDFPASARIEVLRSFIPGLPLLPALISNPIYFDE